MTDELDQPDCADLGDSELPPDHRRPARSMACMGLLLLMIIPTASGLGWLVGQTITSRKFTHQISQISAKNAFLTEQNRHLKIQANQAQQFAADHAGETSVMQARLETLQKRNAGLEHQASNQQQIMRDIHASQEERWQQTLLDLETTRAQLDHYRGAHRELLREVTKGEILGDLTYRDLTLTNAIIEDITPAGIDIRHETGTARLLFTLLPAEMRERFAYEPDEAAEYLAAERQQWLKTRAIADNARLSEEKELQDRERRIAARQVEKEAAKIFKKLASAEKSLAFCRSKLGNPGKIAPEGYKWKIRQLERDITAYENQLEHLGISRRSRPTQ